MHEIKALLSIVAAGKRGVSLAADPLASRLTLHVLNKDSTLIYWRQQGMRPRMRALRALSHLTSPHFTSSHLISSHPIVSFIVLPCSLKGKKVYFIKINSSHCFFLSKRGLHFNSVFPSQNARFSSDLSNRRYQLSSSLAPLYLRNSTRNVRCIGTGSTTSHISQPPRYLQLQIHPHAAQRIS